MLDHSVFGMRIGGTDMFDVDASWKKTFPGASAGFLVMRDVEDRKDAPEIVAAARALEEMLRRRYAGMDRTRLREEPVFREYAAYYRRFDKLYHVQLQVESVVFKNKTVPCGSSLVAAMFLGELKNGLLSAAHDLDRVEPPVILAATDGTETMDMLGGSKNKAQQMKPNDMCMKDRRGIISAVLYGADQRTPLGPDSRHVLYTVYAPRGIDETLTRRHLEDIRDYVLLASPGGRVECLQVVRA
jgi:DNA/RNA-binding domain of Phe-tRNA-synthetase-like protein